MAAKRGGRIRIHDTSTILKPINFPRTYYTVNQTTTTTTTLEVTYRRNSVMSSPGLEDVTPLMLACLQGRSQDVQAILKKKKDTAKERTRTRKTPLHFCVEGGNVKCLELVLGADSSLINARDEEGYTPLHLAVINGNKDVVKALILAQADVNCLDNERHSLVHWATVCGELEILDILLQHGAPATTSDIHMAHPIHYAAQMCGSGNGSHLESRARVQSTVHGVSQKKGLAILRRLIKNGVPVDIRDKDGRQPLLWAASAGSADAILSLVNAGAKVQAEDKDGLTALHCAASRGHTDCIETLVGLCGAEVDVIDNNGCTALFYAVTLGHADCTELLLNFGAEPNRQDRKGRTPAHCGASKGQLETIKLFAKHGGNLWMRNVRGDLPLHEAVLSRRKDLVLWLLSQRPDTANAPNNDGRCPIHLASLNNNVEMVKILIDHHAEINALMRTGKGTAMTPLDAAIHKGNSAVAKFLQLHGGLPANSLNDSSLQRRLNRTLESQARSVSSLHGSQLGHHEFSPDPDRHLHFTSPEVNESSAVHQYVNTVAHSILRQTPHLTTSTPIMDDGVQTDSSHYVRDMEVQMTGEIDLPILGDQTKAMRNEESRLSLSSNTSKRSDKKFRKKRQSISRDKSADDGLESTDTEEKVNSRRSSRRVKSHRKSPEEDSANAKILDHKDKSHQSPDADEDSRSPPHEKAVLLETSQSKSTEDAQNSTQSATIETVSGSQETQESVEKHEEDGDGPAPIDSDTYNNESEKFSELENVAVQSSESEIREEDILGPLEGELLATDAVPRNHSKPSSRPPSSKIGSDQEKPESRRSRSKSGSRKSDEKKRAGSGRQSSGKSSRRESAKDSKKPQEASDQGKDGAINTEIASDHDDVGNTFEPDSEVQSKSTHKLSQAALQKSETVTSTISSQSQGSTDQATLTKSETITSTTSSQSQGSNEQGTITNSEETEPTILNHVEEMSLQEAYARRRRSKSKSTSQSGSGSPASISKKPHTLPDTKTKPSVNGVRSEKSIPEQDRKVGSNIGSSILKDGDAKKPGRLSVREQFKVNKENMEKASEKSTSKVPIRTKGKRMTNSEEREILLQEQLLGLGLSSKSSAKSTSRSPVKRKQSLIPKPRKGISTSSSPREVVVSKLSVSPHPPDLSKVSSRQRNISDGKAGTQSDGNQSTKRDSGYSDKIIPTTSASDEHTRAHLILPKTNNGSLRKKVITRRPGSSSSAVIRRAAVNSAKKSTRSVRDRKRFETNGASKSIRDRLSDFEYRSEETSSHAGSVTSEEGHRSLDFKRRVPRPRSKLTFTKGDDLNARMSPYQKKNMDVDTPISVTQAMQASMRKYHLERRIFQELLELKRHQIRAGKANEQVLVKRLSDAYKKAGLSINYREYDGPYTFRNFEKYLYDQLRLLQANRKLLPRFAPSDDLEKLSTALKKMNATKLPFLDDIERNEACDQGTCAHVTHRCHHAAHAYTGVPCAAYIGQGRKTPLFLPKVDPLKAPGPTQIDPITRNGMGSRPGVQMIISPRDDSLSPITLEVQQGTQSQVFSLPTHSLDPSKNYYVSLSIKPTPTPPIPTDPLNGKNNNPPVVRNMNLFVDDSGSISAPPPPAEQEPNVNLNEIDREKFNQSL